MAVPSLSIPASTGGAKRLRALEVENKRIKKPSQIPRFPHRRFDAIDRLHAIDRTIHRKAAQVGAPSPGSLPSMEGIVGRDAERARLRALVHAAAAGEGVTCLVRGEPGIGKSTLIGAAIGDAEQRGFCVFAGASDELDLDVPFAAVGSSLGGAFELPRTPGGADRTYQIVESIVAFIEETAREQPVLFVVEDVHWADVASLRALRAVGRAARQLPLAVIASMRPTPSRPELRAFADSIGTETTFALEPLDTEVAAVIASRVAGGTPGPRLLEQIGRAAGNPLYVTELARALGEEGQISVAGGVAEVDDVSMPPGLRLTILRRLSFLQPDALELLRVAAVLGSVFSATELAAVAQRGVMDIARALDEMMQAGVVTEHGDRLALRHDLIREAIIEDVPAAMRKALHRDAARALAEAGAPTTRVAEHMSLGADPGDREAVRWLRLAAAEASTRSPAVAVDLFERALALAEPHDPQRAEILVEVLQPLVWTGRADRAEALAREALASGVGPSARVAIHAAVAGAIGFQGNLWRAAEELDLASSVDEAPLSDRARWSASGAYIRAMLGDPSGNDRARSALETARAVGSRFGEAMATQALAIIAAGRGDVHEAIGLARESARFSAGIGDDERISAQYLLPGFWLAATLLDADRFEESEQAIVLGRGQAEATGVPANLAVLEWLLALLKFTAGAWDDALAAADTAWASSEETQQRAGMLVGHAVRASIAFHRDDLAAAEEQVSLGEQEIAARGAQVGVELIAWLRLLLNQAGGSRAGIDVLDLVWDALAPARFLFTFRSVAPDVVRCALLNGDEERARAIVTELEEGARRMNTPSAEGVAMRCRAYMDRTADTALAAVEAFRRSPRVLDRAQACEEASSFFGSRDASRLLLEAFELYEALGARRDLARVDAALVAVGARTATQRRPRPTHGWEALTKTEREVVRLAAEGLTNRQIGEKLFVSRRTVETHLGHVFQKLGMTTRVQLAAEVARRSL